MNSGIYPESVKEDEMSNQLTMEEIDPFTGGK